MRFELTKLNKLDYGMVSFDIDIFIQKIKLKYNLDNDLLIKIKRYISQTIILLNINKKNLIIKTLDKYIGDLLDKDLIDLIKFKIEEIISDEISIFNLQTNRKEVNRVFVLFDIKDVNINMDIIIENQNTIETLSFELQNEIELFINELL